MGRVKPEDCFSERELMDYKEAFTVIDKDGDGEISVKELKACFNELGQVQTCIKYLFFQFIFIYCDWLKGEKAKEDELKEMVAEAKGPLNYNAFICLFADKLNGTDDEAMMLEAFKCLDNSNSGSFNIDE